MPFSPDRSRSESPLSPEVKTKLIRRIITDLQSTIEPYEHLYISPHELTSFQVTPFGKQRFSHFQAWIKQLLEQTSVPASWKLNQKELEEAVLKVETLYRTMLDVITNKTLSAELSEQYAESPLTPEEFLLKREDIPIWKKLSSRTSIDGGVFGLLWVAREYRSDLKSMDIKPTEQDLLMVGYAVSDEAKRIAFLRSVDPEYQSEALSPARIFDIGNLIKEEQEDGPPGLHRLTTKELLEAFDAAGVRPATLPELLAYARSRWQPTLDFSSSLTPEERAQHADSHSVYALGSVFSPFAGNRYIASLNCDGRERSLRVASFRGKWNRSHRFLVFRKESTS